MPLLRIYLLLLFRAMSFSLFNHETNYQFDHLLMVTSHKYTQISLCGFDKHPKCPNASCPNSRINSQVGTYNMRMMYTSTFITNNINNKTFPYAVESKSLVRCTLSFVSYGLLRISAIFCYQYYVLLPRVRNRASLRHYIANRTH